MIESIYDFLTVKALAVYIATIVTFRFFFSKKPEQLKQINERFDYIETMILRKKVEAVPNMDFDEYHKKKDAVDIEYTK